MKAVRKQEWIGWQRKVYIYALIDPRSETIRYIGQAVDPSKRLWEHGHGLHGAKSVWIMLLREKGLSPKMVILEESPRNMVDERELAWISHAEAEGWPILNVRGTSDVRQRGQRERMFTQGDWRRWFAEQDQP